MNRAMGTRGWQAAFLRYSDRITRVFVPRNEGIERSSRKLAKEILIAKLAFCRVYAFFLRRRSSGGGGFGGDCLQKLKKTISRTFSAAAICQVLVDDDLVETSFLDLFLLRDFLREWNRNDFSVQATWIKGDIFHR